MSQHAEHNNICISHNTARAIATYLRRLGPQSPAEDEQIVSIVEFLEHRAQR